MPSLNSLSLTWDEQDRPVITVQYKDAVDAQAGVDHNEWLIAFAERLGDESASNLRALIEMNKDRGGPVALTDLADQLDVEKRKIEGWNRNLGRSVKAVVRDYGFLRKDHEDGTAQVLDFKWDQPGNRWLYSIPEKYRDTLVKALDER